MSAPTDSTFEQQYSSLIQTLASAQSNGATVHDAWLADVLELSSTVTATQQALDAAEAANAALQAQLAQYSTPDDFVPGQTRPLPGTAGLGNKPGTVFQQYDGAPLRAGQVYENVDFGSYHLPVNVSDVHFVNCKSLNVTIGDVHSDPGPMFDCRGGSNYADRTFHRHEFTNASPWGPTSAAVQGYGFLLDRSIVRGFGDGLDTFVPSARLDTPVDVALVDSYVGELGWYWSAVSGVAHPSDVKTHNDCVQHSGGRGLVGINTFLDAHYSTTVGTGTPNSGSEVQGTAVPYTQAAGEAARYSIVDGGGLYATGQPGAHLGGSISGLMVNSTRGATPAMQLRRMWASGGAYWLNAGDVGLVGDMGVITGLRAMNDQRIAGYALGLRSVLTAYLADNKWPDGTDIIRKAA